MSPEQSINTLCTTVRGKFRIHCVPTAAPLEQCMMDFWIMSQEYNSGLFSDYWRDRLTVVMSEGRSLTLADVLPEVWTPVYSKCDNLLAQLRDYSLSLSAVDQLFKDMGTDTIRHSIKHLYRGVEMCRTGREVKDLEWIEGVVEHMDQYWKLCQYTDTAQAFLELRDALDLSGDFQLVQKLAEEVSGTA